MVSPYNETATISSGKDLTDNTLLRPDYKEFSRLARDFTLVPVVKSVTADLLTPVSAFLAIAVQEPDAFLLESVERGEQIGRYTFLGARPYLQVRARGEEVVLQRGKARERRAGDVLPILKELLRPTVPPHSLACRRSRPVRLGTSPMTAVRQLERIGEHAKDDLALPDCVLMFFDRLLAFDHLRHQIHIIATADVSRESPRRAYDRAVADIAILEKKLARGLRPADWNKLATRQGQAKGACRNQPRPFHKIRGAR